MTIAVTHHAIPRAQRIQTLECSPDSPNLSPWGWDGIGASHSRQRLPGCLASEDQSWKEAPIFTGCPWVPSSAALPCGWLTLGTQRVVDEPFRKEGKVLGSRVALPSLF